MYNNAKSSIINKVNLFIIIKTINAKLNINKIDPNRIIDIMKFIKEINLHLIINKFNYNVELINDEIVRLYLINSSSMRLPLQNTKEDQKNEMKYHTTQVIDDDSNNLTNLSFNKNKVLDNFNNHFQYNDIILFVDTKYQNLSNTDTALFNFNISNNTKNKQVRSGSITAVGNITNIVQFEIVPFSIPFVSTADNIHGKITLSLREFTSDCIEAYENAAFHFIFSAEVKKNSIMLTPDNSIYKFRKPITELNELTLRFGSPLTPIIFPKDRLRTRPIDYSNSPGILEFNENHNLQTGDIISIDEFISDDMAADMDILAEINGEHPIVVIDCKRISINIGFRKLQTPTVGQTIEVYFLSKRIMFPLKVKYIINDST